MKKKKETAKGEKSKKTQRTAEKPTKQEANKWQEFLRRHSKEKK